MPSKAPVRYCRIHLWLQHHEPALAEAITSLCMEGMLSAPPRGPGKTFIVPGKAVMKTIIDLVTEEDVEKAVTLVKAHIVPVYAPKGSDFKQDIGSMAGFSLTGTGADGSAKLAGGAEIKRVASYKSFKDRENTAVWRVEKGELPISGAPWDPKKARDVRGGGETLGPSREHIWSELCQQAQLKGGDLDAVLELFATRATGLLEHLKDNSPEAFRRLLTVLPPNPIAALAIALEPCRPQDHFISDQDLSGWFEKRHAPHVAGRILHTFFSDPKGTCEKWGVPAEFLAAPIFSDPYRVIESREEACVGIGTCVSMVPEVIAMVEKQVAANWPEEVVPSLANGRAAWQGVVIFFVEAHIAAAAADSSRRVECISDALGLCQAGAPLCGRDFAAEVRAYCGGADSAVGRAGHVANSIPAFRTLPYFPYSHKAAAEMRRREVNNPATSATTGAPAASGTFDRPTIKAMAEREPTSSSLVV